MTDVIINEVGPRDGLQSQAGELSLEQRRVFIEALLAAGLRHIEIGSFVSPKAVPQMAGTGELAGALLGRTDAELSALVPNMKGYELARAAGIDTVAVVVSATETMNRRNINLSLADTLATAEAVIERGAREGAAVQAYLAVAFECPFEGAVDAEVVRAQARRLLDAGTSLLVIADTIGAADPGAVRRLMSTLVEEHGPARLACHFHDTRALGVANVYAAIEAGVRRFDSSVGGLGGCPFAPGARGNVATEDVVMLCEQMGLATGISMPRLLEVVDLISDMLGRPQGGRALEWLRSHAA
ncbi:MAG: hydroxymethylglutaryl-CoA lyase [Halieaceae bacterium]|jgi:hydroxymethylglutaryl-CoA lyase|nr:hydroxymethylglutaryl-CoA lyase [Halieaceae bacterium]